MRKYSNIPVGVINCWEGTCLNNDAHLDAETCALNAGLMHLFVFLALM